MRHHGFLAVVLAATAAATGWIFSRSDVVDASEEQTSSYREAYAQSDTEIQTVEDPKGLRLNYYGARWNRVLNDVSKHAELTLVMDKIPAGRFARRDKTRYGTDDCIRILNRELEGLGFRLLKQGNFLVVLHLDQARSRYARPVLPSARTTGNQTALKNKRPARPASARVDQLNAQWASEGKNTSDDTMTRRPVSTTTIPIRTSTVEEPQDTVRQRNTSETAAVTEDLPGAVIREIKVKHATAAEVARALYLVFERRAELIRKGLQNKPTFVVYDTDDTEKEDEPLFRIGIDQQQNSLIVEAGAKRADQLVKLLQRLDKPQTDQQNDAAKLIPSEKINEETVVNLNKQLRHLVALKAQEKAALPDISEDEPAPEPVDSTAFNLRGDVNIQAMQGTGTLLIEGNDEDLQRLLPIIRRLEQLSIGSLPDIHLVELEHVNSEAFAELLTSVYDRLSELRKRGDDDRQSVAFFSVGQPNSVLILAPQLELPAILDLAEKLDTKLDPESEFEVFPLKHAIAAQVVSALENFYEERPGLATRIRSIADTRTNTVIVQGHPRDLAEVERLVEGLDRNEPEAVHQVKVIELNHATAEELAEVLNGAIQAATSPPQTSSGRSSGFGGNQGPQELRDTKSIALEFLATDGDARQLIRSGFLVDVRINADPRSNALIVSAPEASMSLLQALITTLDRAPSAVAAIKVFALKNADAEQSVALLSTMFENTNQEEQLGVQIAGAEDAASSLIPLQFSADIRTNSVLAVGSEEALSIVEAILLRLDTDDTRQRTTTVIPLRNAPAELVADSINRFLEQQQSLQDSTDDLISNIERVRQEVIVAEDTNSNSLIVSASPDYFSQITQIINELDATPPQVIIQALLVEVQLNNTDEFGIELGFQDPLLFSRSIVEDTADLITIPTSTLVPGVGTVQSTTVITQNSTPGFNFNNTAAPLGNNATGNTGAVGGQGISSFSLGRQNGDLGFGGFVFSAQSDAVNVLIRALAARRTLHVLSRPQIRTTHNNEAIIRVGQEVPVVDGVVINNGIVSPEIIQKETGIILRVTPRITPDGTVAMDVYAEKSALAAGGVPIFTDISTGNVIESQVRDVSIADTTVNIPNGQTIVIGGMITKTDDTIERKVPWLGDLPVLGKTFRYDSNNTVRTELLIFLTPRIIYGDADSELIKQIESERLHFLESEAEEIHGPIYSVPPSATPADRDLIPTQDSLVPGIPSEVPAYQAQSQQQRPGETDERTGVRTMISQRDSTSSQIRSARLSSEKEESEDSWIRRFMKKKQGHKPDSNSSSRSEPTSRTMTQDFDFDDQEWN